MAFALEDGMDTNANDSRVEFVYSDIEEGEIPEFEISESAVTSSKNVLALDNHSLKFIDSNKKWDYEGLVNRSVPVGLQMPPGSFSENSVYLKQSKLRYASPPSEGECFSEDDEDDGEEEGEGERKFARTHVMQKSLAHHGSSFFHSRRRSTYLRPFQSTCGSVEDIMTKIGETLGRNNSSYCRGRKLKEPDRCVDGSAVGGSLMKEPNPLIKRIKVSSYYSKRGRHSENNAATGSAVSGKKANKDGKALGSWRKVERNRKRGNRETSVGEISPKYKALTRNERDWYEAPKCVKKNWGFDNVEKENTTDDVSVTVVPCKSIDEATGESGRGVEVNKDPLKARSTLVAPISSNALKNECVDDCLATRNCNYSPEQLLSNNEDEGEQVRERGHEVVDEEDDDGEEEDDDDIELIKLRLLALTSNKKKGHVAENKPNKNVDTCKINSIEKANNGGNLEAVKDDSDRRLENTSLESSETVVKHRDDTDIDRYELLLRAEALKTALLKKHRHKIKRQKNTVPNHGDIDELNSEAMKTNEMNDCETHQVNQSNEIYNAVPLVTEQKSTREESTGNCDKSAKNAVEARDLSYKSSFELEVSSNPAQSRSTEVSAGGFFPPFQDISHLIYGHRKSFSENQHLKKRKKKVGRNKKRRDFNSDELNIKENNGVLDNESDGGVNKTKSEGPGDERKRVRRSKDHERKFILIDSLQTSNFQEVNSLVSPERKLMLGSKNNGEDISLSETISDANSQARLKGQANEVERIIVHLGSESSDEESASELNKSEGTSGVSTKDSDTVNTQKPPSVDNSNQILNYEKSVELLLEEARRRIENKSQVSSKVPSTPEAVYSHLAPSQRLEYMRLKKKIAERERMKKAIPRNSCHWQGINGRTTLDGDEADTRPKVDKNIGISLPPASKNRLFDGNVLAKVIPNDTSKGLKEEIRSIEKPISVDEVSTPLILSCVNNKALQAGESGDATLKGGLADKEKKPKLTRVKNETGELLCKGALKKPNTLNGTLTADLERSILERKKILTQNKLHLERLKILWKKIKIEKMIEGKYEKELKKLRVQQNLFELKINQQRIKIKKLAEETKQVYEAFQRNNKGMDANAKKRKNIYKEKAPPLPAPDRPPPLNVDSQINSLKKASGGSTVEQIKGEETEAVDSKEASTNRREPNDDSPKKNIPDDLKEYNSPLLILNIGSEKSQRRVDPNAIMCQFDLLGKCNDEECVFQHWRT